MLAIVHVEDQQSEKNKMEILDLSEDFFFQLNLIIQLKYHTLKRLSTFHT